MDTERKDGGVSHEAAQTRCPMRVYHAANVKPADLARSVCFKCGGELGGHDFIVGLNMGPNEVMILAPPEPETPSDAGRRGQ